MASDLTSQDDNSPLQNTDTKMTMTTLEVIYQYTSMPTKGYC